MPLLLQRVCQNRHQWTRPSGYPKDEGFPKRAGFGWDEWTFCFSDVYKGNIYTHTPYDPSAEKRDALGPEFCVAFWTKDPRTKSFLLIGFYLCAQWTTEPQSIAFENWMKAGKEASIWKRRILEIRDVTRHSRSQIEGEFGPGNYCWRLRCPSDETQVLKTPLKISAEVLSAHQRLARPPIWQGGSTPTDLLAICKPLGHSDAAEELKRRLGYERRTPGQTSTVDLVEEMLREHFVSFLREDKYKYSDIKVEVNRIDVAFTADGETQIAELKSFESAISPHTALRSALGQLLSYNYGHGRSVVSRWWIVLDQNPSEADWKFLKVVASKHQLPLTVAYRKQKSFKVQHLG